MKKNSAPQTTVTTTTTTTATTVTTTTTTSTVTTAGAAGRAPSGIARTGRTFVKCFTVAIAVLNATATIIKSMKVVAPVLLVAWVIVKDLFT